LHPSAAHAEKGSFWTQQGVAAPQYTLVPVPVVLEHETRHAPLPHLIVAPAHAAFWQRTVQGFAPPHWIAPPLQVHPLQVTSHGPVPHWITAGLHAGPPEPVTP
jgi:hypothetical protein